ncbi:autotransporter domain-containing protein [Martelella sp. HB161492]|uniref:autotransporter domain-containing protein n=1 Tax=Martelella sp. HB161492 TaxID=2720726 RepID=UPI001590D4A5|nr:autotransporter domain-containing protein [Martelella sp. HB161492]
MHLIENQVTPARSGASDAYRRQVRDRRVLAGQSAGRSRLKAQLWAGTLLTGQLIIATAGLLSLTGLPVQAAEVQYWNSGNGGSGTWSTSASNWSDSSGTVSSWAGGTAVFGTAAGTVTLASPQSFVELDFNQMKSGGNYTLTGQTLTAGRNATIYVDNGLAPVIASALSLGSGLYKTGGGQLVLNAPSTSLVGGGIYVEDGELYITGALNTNMLWVARSDREQASVTIDAGVVQICGNAEECSGGAGILAIGSSSETPGAMVIENSSTVTADFLVVYGSLEITGGSSLSANSSGASPRVIVGSGVATATLTISGAQSNLTLTTNAKTATITFGDKGVAEVYVEQGGQIRTNGPISIGTNGGSATVTVDGADSRISTSYSGGTPIEIGTNGGTGTLILSGGGTVKVSGSNSVVSLAAVASSGSNQSAATLVIGAAYSNTSLSTTAEPGELDVDTLQFGLGSSTLIFNHTAQADDSYYFGVTLASANVDNALIQQLAGFTLFDGDDNTYSGTVEVNGGYLDIVDQYELLGSYIVNGGTLAGSGTVGSVVVGTDTAGITFDATSESTSPYLSPGDIDGNAHGTLTIEGDLTLNASATLQLQLTTANRFGVVNDLIIVDGNVTLGGTLEASLSSVFSQDPYPIITYTGSISGSFDVVPKNYTIQIDYNAKVVYLIWDSLDTSGYYWNGGKAGQTTNGLYGGSGTWSQSMPDWSNEDGSMQPEIWPYKQGITAIFTGANAGTVTVESVQFFGALKFGITDDGQSYTLTGGTLVPWAEDGETATIDVASMKYPTVIASTISYSGAVSTAQNLTKTGAGSLTLAGKNNIVGDLQVAEGTLRLTGTMTATKFEVYNDIVDDDSTSTAGASTMIVDGGSLTLSGASVVGGAESQQYSMLQVINKGIIKIGYNTELWGMYVGNHNKVNPARIEILSGGQIIIEKCCFAVGQDLSGYVDTRYGVLAISGLGSLGQSEGVNAATAPEAVALIILQDQGVLDLWGNLWLTYDASSSQATLLFGSDPDETAKYKPGSLTGNGEVQFGAGTATIIFNHTATEDDQYEFSKTLAVKNPGTHLIEHMAGYTKFTGDGSAFDGTTNITGGTLQLDGSLSGTINVGGDDLPSLRFVSNGAQAGNIVMLAHGKLDMSTSDNPQLVANANSLTMADSDAEMHFAANFTDYYGGSPTSAMLKVNGLVSLTAGTIFLDFHWPDDSIINKGVIIITSTQEIDFVDAENGGVDVEPQQTVLSSGDETIGLSPELSSDGKSLKIFLEVNSDSLAADADEMTTNSAAVTHSLISLGNRHDLLVNYALISAEHRDWAAQILSGDIYASEATAMVANSRYVRDVAGRHIRDVSGGIATGEAIATVSNYAAQPAAATTPAFDGFAESNSGIDLWATGYGAWSSFDGDSTTGAASASNNVGGFVFGADAAAFGNLRLGALGAYGHSAFKADDHYASGTSNDVTFGLYGGGSWGAIGVDFGAAYTWHDINTNRTIAMTYLEDDLESDYTAGTFQLFGGVGYTFDVGHGMRLEPFLDAAYVHYQAGNITEAGGALALSVLDSDMNTGYTTVGLRGAWDFDIGASQNKLTGALGWRHAYGDVEPFANVGFALGGDMQMIAGTPLASDQAVVSLGWVTELNKTVSIGVDYTGLFGGGSNSQTVSGKLNFRF